MDGGDKRLPIIPLSSVSMTGDGPAVPIDMRLLADHAEVTRIQADALDG